MGCGRSKPQFTVIVPDEYSFVLNICKQKLGWSDNLYQAVTKVFEHHAHCGCLVLSKCCSDVDAIFEEFLYDNNNEIKNVTLDNKNENEIKNVTLDTINEHY
jgi:hypothetical protein